MADGGSAQVRTRMRHKKIGRTNGSPCHNFVTKGELLSLAASGHSGRFRSLRQSSESHCFVMIFVAKAGTDSSLSVWSGILGSQTL